MLDQINVLIQEASNLVNEIKKSEDNRGLVLGFHNEGDFFSLRGARILCVLAKELENICQERVNLLKGMLNYEGVIKYEERYGENIFSKTPISVCPVEEDSSSSKEDYW